MTKTYKCKLSATSLLVNVKGKVIRLEFEPDVITSYGLRGCSYRTSNKDMQHAIERTKRFNSALKDAIWTDDVEPKEEVAEEKKVVRRGRTKKED